MASADYPKHHNAVVKLLVGSTLVQLYLHGLRLHPLDISNFILVPCITLIKGLRYSHVLMQNYSDKNVMSIFSGKLETWWHEEIFPVLLYLGRLQNLLDLSTPWGRRHDSHFWLPAASKTRVPFWTCPKSFTAYAQLPSRKHLFWVTSLHSDGIWPEATLGNMSWETRKDTDPANMF